MWEKINDRNEIAEGPSMVRHIVTHATTHTQTQAHTHTRTHRQTHTHTFLLKSRD